MIKHMTKATFSRVCLDSRRLKYMMEEQRQEWEAKGSHLHKAEERANWPWPRVCEISKLDPGDILHPARQLYHGHKHRHQLEMLGNSCT